MWFFLGLFGQKTVMVSSRRLIVYTLLFCWGARTAMTHFGWYLVDSTLMFGFIGFLHSACYFDKPASRKLDIFAA
ncbi:hypothetical protein QR685DRAFT_568980 [Neurospora intermedia]|uniref:Uncharacterized protein n=1 Tax=Neurospora intermedia TaxID=5142 RepID=A0ABR3DJF2_NEUIN